MSDIYYGPLRYDETTGRYVTPFGFLTTTWKSYQPQTPQRALQWYLRGARSWY